MRISRLFFFFSLGLMMTLGLVSQAFAATIMVDTVTDEINDPGPDTGCSLREAIQAANADTTYGGCTAGSGADTIAFAISTNVGNTGPFVTGIAGAGEDLNQTGDFDITSSITFQGNGSAFTVINGAILDRVFHIVTNTGLTVTFNNLRIIGGDAGAGNGGGVFIRGDETVNMNNVLIDANAANGNGGGIYADNNNVLTIVGSIIDGNSVLGNGGGIFSNGGGGAQLNLDNSIVQNNTANTGGGIYGDSVMDIFNGSLVTGNDATQTAGGIRTGNSLTVDNSDITLNDALADHSGGIFNTGAASTTDILNDSHVDGNTAATIGGGIYNEGGTLNVTDSTVDGNTSTFNGGGIVHGGSVAGATATITRSTISNNTSGDDGGGLMNQNNVIMNISNSTVSGNSAVNNGGGIGSLSLVPSLTIASSTIANNSATTGDGLYVDSGTASIVNSILDQTVNCAGAVTVTSNGYNIDSGNTCAFASTGDLINTDPLLGALAVNAPGLTATHALLAGSPAINAGSTALTVDQRGFARPDGLTDDIGAYEYDVTPVLAEVTPVPVETTDDTPDYTFSSTDSGTIAYGGSCSSATTVAVAGNNTITFNALSIGLHDDCTITVTDGEANVSNVLDVTGFEYTSSSSGGGTAGGMRTLYVTPVTEPAPTEPAPPSGFVTSFTDIAGHWAESYITSLEATCALTGYLDANGDPLNLFIPDSNISRAELLTMLIKCKYGVLPTVSVAPFPDVSTSHWAAQYIAKGLELGIVGGYEDGTFGPNAFATRGEALKMILLTYLETTVVPDASPASCTDIDPAAWYAPYFDYAMAHGIVSGYKDAGGNATGLCGPGNDVTRGESAKMIVTAGGL